MNGLRILHLIDGLNIGGAEVLLRDLTLGLHEAGYQVSVGYSTAGPIEESIDKRGISLTKLPRLTRIDPGLFWRISRLIGIVKPQIVHTHLFKSDFHGRLAARLGRVPVVVSTAHNNDAWARCAPLGYAYGLTARLADRIIAVSDEVRDFQIRYTGTPAEKFITINNGVDVCIFENRIDKRKAGREAFGLGLSEPVVGIIGRLEQQKDHESFLHAAVTIKATLPDARFLVVGDGSMRDELVALAHSLDLLPAVIFCGIRKDIPTLLASMDLLVFSSRWEGLPVALLEGMASGLPVVSTAVGGIPGAIVEHETGLLVPPENPEALAKACLVLLQDSELSRKYGEAGRKRVIDKFSIQSMITQTIELYENLWQSYVTTANSFSF